MNKIYPTRNRTVDIKSSLQNANPHYLLPFFTNHKVHWVNKKISLIPLKNFMHFKFYPSTPLANDDKVTNIDQAKEREREWERETSALGAVSEQRKLEIESTICSSVCIAIDFVRCIGTFMWTYCIELDVIKEKLLLFTLVHSPNELTILRVRNCANDKKKKLRGDFVTK